MFKLLSLFFTLVQGYMLYGSLTGLETAFAEKQGIEAIVYYGIYSIIWVVGIASQYIAVFSGTEIYVTTQNQE